MKRILDLIISSIGLIILLPFLLVISLLIILDSKGGMFFSGPRVGKNGKTFKILKFRSMKPDCEGKGKWNVGDNDNRITRIGHFLRKTKIDEIPQLLNVIKGDMSLVGPRPELRVYTDMYTDEEKAILDLKPGITDWASMANYEQFKGFTSAADPDTYYVEKVRPLKLKLQLYYRYNHNVLTDMYCILYTVFKVIIRTDKLPKEIQSIVDEYRNEEMIEHMNAEI